MLTLFTIPKAFHGHTGLIQRNAIRSWTLLRPACEIILFGDDQGTAELAAEFGLRHVPEIARNEYGTPLISDVFGQAQTLAGHDLLAYVNADIILLDDFVQAVDYAAHRKRLFLMCGRRWNIEVTEPFEFGARWQQELKSYILSDGQLFDPSGIDYFIFRHGVWGEIPPFAIGRTLWDNWLIFSARQRGVAVIDATERITAVHQNHDYGHLRNGKSEAWNGPEAKRNFQLAGGDYKFAFTLEDATWVLTKQGLLPALSRTHLRRRWDALGLFHPRLHYGLSYSINAIRRRLPGKFESQRRF
jgi:hypothetical protein